MKYFKIEYGCGCGMTEEYVELETQKEADDYAYEKAVEDYETYEGLHGIRTMHEIAEEDFDIDLDDIDYDSGDYMDIQMAYRDEIESSISYSAEEISEEEYHEYIEEN
jgi:hypothetical protein